MRSQYNWNINKILIKNSSKLKFKEKLDFRGIMNVNVRTGFEIFPNTNPDLTFFQIRIWIRPSFKYGFGSYQNPGIRQPWFQLLSFDDINVFLAF